MKSFDQTAARLKSLLRTEQNFDIVSREITARGKKILLFFVDGFVKDDILQKILEFFYSFSGEGPLASPQILLDSGIPYGEVMLCPDETQLVEQVLSGMTAVYVQGWEGYILIDIRTYPQRETGEPEKDKVFRGSHDGFVETMVLNCALIRRRIRTRQLSMESHTLGSLSHTDLCLCYLADTVDTNLLDRIRQRIQHAQVSALTMNLESLTEVLLGKHSLNPFPKFKYTERPDTAAAQILEGNIVLLVDNSPSAMILPVSLFDIMEEANDYYFPPLTGCYLRLSRFTISLMTIILTPLWLLFVQSPQLTPAALSFILPDDPQNIPVFWQLIILEIAIDGLKLASLSTPSMLTTSLSVIAGIVVGDFAVDSGWFCAESMLYMALVAIANYNQPGFELAYAFKYLRVFLLITTYLAGPWGFGLGIAAALLFLACTPTLSGRAYLYPLIPLDLSALKKKLFRIGKD